MYDVLGLKFNFWDSIKGLKTTNQLTQADWNNLARIWKTRTSIQNAWKVAVHRSAG